VYKEKSIGNYATQSIDYSTKRLHKTVNLIGLVEATSSTSQQNHYPYKYEKRTNKKFNMFANSRPYLFHLVSICLFIPPWVSTGLLKITYETKERV